MFFRKLRQYSLCPRFKKYMLLFKYTNVCFSLHRMRYVAAYLLAVLGGNESPSSKDLKKILDSVGIETDDERVNKVRLNK